jgi:hypothetical protein
VNRIRHLHAFVATGRKAAGLNTTPAAERPDHELRT